MYKNIKQTIACIVLAAFLLPQFACTKEKAVAIKTAADSFRVEAESALDQTGNLLRLSIAIPPKPRDAEIEEITNELRSNDYTENQLIIFLEERLRPQDPASGAERTIERELDDLKSEYQLFSSMFRSLPRGYLFTKNTVIRAERHAIRLTYRMVKMAKSIDDHPIQNLSARSELAEKIIAARSIEDVNQRDRKLAAAAQDLLDLRSSEIAANDRVKKQLLKAAASGATVLDLIRNYERWSVADISNAMGDSLKILDEISGSGNAEIKKLIKKYQELVESKLSSDAVWRQALSLK